MTPVRLVLLAVGLVASVALVAVVGGAYSGSGDWAAKVNGREISERDFLRELEQLRDNEAAAQALQLPPSSDGSIASGVSAAWLSRLIQDTLVELEVERRDVEVGRRHRQEAEQAIVQQFGGPQVWDGFEDWFRERQTRRLASLLALTDTIGGTVTEEQLRAEYDARKEFLEQACTSHILVENEEQAREVEAQLDEGADFGELAREHSIDTNSAANGGEIGCFGRGEGLVAPYETAMFSLEEGEISEPVETQFGFHIIRLDRLETPTFEEARPQLESSVRGQSQQRFAEVMGGVLADADIEVNPKYGSRSVDDPTGRIVVPPSSPVVPEELPTGDEPPDTGGIRLTP